jgi:2-succinyl-5-enolpyruvyl-6-hydroxy-3-cyclohexene-1-carboxylate synthase
MKLSEKKSIQQLVITVASLGLKNVVISPGSRNAPLIISFNQHPDIGCNLIRDERSAGFFALGKAIETREPVGLICTSGTATLNFAPAIAEAYYLRIPLIVFTADRPEEWVGQGDGQTINQTDIYHNYIRKSFQLNGETDDEDQLWYNSRCLSEGFAIATKINRGPVHFNIPFREPLFAYKETENIASRNFTSATGNFHLNRSQLNELHTIFSHSKKVMVLAGQYFPDSELNGLLSQLAALDNVIVLCETTTNVHDPEFIENIDRCIVPLDQEEISSLMPDLLITIGGAIISKKIKKVLRENKPAHHWNIHPFDSLIDTYQSLTKAIPQTAVYFLKQFLPDLSSPTQSTYKKQWRERAAFVAKKHLEYSADVAYSDFFVFDKIFKKIPEGTHLHFSNSSAIRYAQLFSCKFATHCNRGISGIDGCTSTAMGAAASRPDTPFLLITGDIAFFYDNNAFWNDKMPENLKIILINNSGGGIFRIIKGPSETEELEEFFEAKHHISAKKLVEFYGWDYLSAHDEKSLESELIRFFSTDTRKTVLEIFTPNQLNSQALASYFSYLGKTIEKL